jgi:hypothetical protein
MKEGAMNMSEIKPFGFMAENFNEEAIRHAVPSAWRGTASEYGRWIDERVKQIKASVWPEWNKSTKEWTGKAVDTAIALSAADLKLMEKLGSQYLEPSRQDSELNRFWFKKEDDLFDDEFGVERFKRIFGDTPRNQRRSALFTDGGYARYAGSIGWLLKERLQRPRAHQMAYWIAGPRPVLRTAASAWSPSAISGHAFQGLVACLRVFVDSQGNDDKWSDEDTQKLCELAADLGDRRVFAGVHYPSDNALSWSVALNLVEHIGANKTERIAMTRFIKRAIQSSRVYAAMLASPAHEQCLRLLEPWVETSTKRGTVKPGH